MDLGFWEVSPPEMGLDVGLAAGLGINLNGSVEWKSPGASSVEHRASSALLSFSTGVHTNK